MKENERIIDEKDFAKAIKNALDEAINDWVKDILQKKIMELRFNNSLMVKRFKEDKDE